MLNDNRLIAFGLALVATGLVASWTGSPEFVSMCYTAALIMFGLGYSIKMPKTTGFKKGLLLTQLSSTGLWARYKDTPEFRQAVDFCINLAPHEFLRFVRVIVDIRYDQDQEALKSTKKS